MTTAAKRRTGRPENPDLRDKVLRAAIEIYAEKGWNGFNFDAVSTCAGVGRPALYRRWSDRLELLVDAFKQLTPGLVDQDLGSLRDELIQLGADYADMMRGPRGLAGTRLMADAEVHPKLFAPVTAEITGHRHELVQRSVQRALERGETEVDCSTDISLLLFGALWTWSIAAATGGMAYAARQDVERLVDRILSGSAVVTAPLA